MLTYPVAFLLALAVAAVLTPMVARFAHWRGWFDLPSEARKIHTRPIPRLGGIAVAVAFFAPLVGLSIYTNRLSSFLYADSQMFMAFCVGSLGILVLGVYDDLRGAGALLKLGVQSAVAVGVWAAGFRIEILGNPFGPVLELGWLSLPLTVVWIVGVVNALNLIDGLDGLASGIAMTASVVLFGVAFQGHMVLLCLLSAALAGALSGFLFHNFNPAKIFLGDSGSMLLGFILATISVWTQVKGATAAAIIIPVLALGVPILDTTLSFVRRVSRKQSPFKADREHMHHRLLELGLSHRHAVLTLYTTSAVFALAGLALLDNDVTHRTIVLSTVAVVVFILVRRLGFAGSRARLSTAAIPRDAVRATARAVRDAEGADEAWRCLKPLVEELPWAGLRLSLLRGEGLGERQEQVYHAWRQSQGAAQADAGGNLRLILEESGEAFGELTVFYGEDKPSTEHRVAAELIRDALTDFCVLRRSSADRRGQVVPLARPSGRTA